jgi:hypothetical protein
MTAAREPAGRSIAPEGETLPRLDYTALPGKPIADRSLAVQANQGMFGLPTKSRIIKSNVKNGSYFPKTYPCIAARSLLGSVVNIRVHLSLCQLFAPLIQLFRFPRFQIHEIPLTQRVLLLVGIFQMNASTPP